MHYIMIMVNQLETDNISPAKQTTMTPSAWFMEHTARSSEYAVSQRIM